MIRLFLKSFLLLITFGILQSCQNDTGEQFEELENLNTEEKQTPELAYPNMLGEITTVLYEEQEFIVEKINDDYVFEGDILIPSESLQKSAGRSNKVRRWINGIVPYVIDPALPNQQRVTDAIAHWEEKTTLRFVLRTNESDYVNFRPGNGCSSFVGRIGGIQNITLDTGCTTGTTIHEIGHAVGLWHEQSRADRNQHIIINFNNIPPHNQFNFQTYVQQGTDGQEYTTDFDFNSIMMYGPFFFSANGQPTITKLDGSTYQFQRDGLSEGDIKGIEAMYDNIWLKEYAIGAGGWKVERNPRVTGDVNGDGLDDVVGFGENSVLVSLSNGGVFSPSQEWSKSFTFSSGWTQQHPRTVADVNGDGKADIVGFFKDAVYVSLSTGNGFSSATKWSQSYTYNSGWRIAKHVRRLADVNGDGNADIVGFFKDAVYVSLSNGSSFLPAKVWTNNYTVNHGWEVDKHPRVLADVNGDNNADIVAFGQNSVFVSLSDGITFKSGQVWSTNYTYANGWRTDKHVLTVADNDGDGNADIIAFGQNRVEIAESNGSSFGNPLIWISNDYTYEKGGWRVKDHIRATGDFDGDNNGDIIGFGQGAVYVSLGN